MDTGGDTGPEVAALETAITMMSIYRDMANESGEPGVPVEAALNAHLATLEQMLERARRGEAMR